MVHHETCARILRYFLLERKKESKAQIINQDISLKSKISLKAWTKEITKLYEQCKLWEWELGQLATEIDYSPLSYPDISDISDVSDSSDSSGE